MKTRVFIASILTIFLVDTQMSAAKTMDAASRDVSPEYGLSDLLSAPTMTIPKLLAPSADVCDSYDAACTHMWLEDWYGSCLLLGGENSGYGGCYCSAQRLYYNCMVFHGCGSKGASMVQMVASQYCFIPQ